MKLYEDYQELIEKALKELSFQEGMVGEACQYHLESGGKRIRPVLLLYFSQNNEEALPFAVALELIHNYSLVHDDLPAMDDDDYRRGKETVHKKYGEAIAILAGDALLNKAYEILFEALEKKATSERIQASIEISRCAGVHGMIYGQELDMVESPNIKEMIHHKTGKLFEAAMMAGSYLAKREDLEEVLEFSKAYGYLFQLTDDLEDLEEDLENEKKTYITEYGEKSSREWIDELKKKAFKFCENEEDNFLKEIVDKTVNRA